jgi:hypothetical protein
MTNSAFANSLQANPNDTTSQGCVNLVSAILGLFCSGNKTKT